MIKYPKRLIEVDLPIARISAHARREKSIRHGHISTLHIWWARRPLAACRAVICAALWPDPADELCPQAFRDAAVDQIESFAARVYPKKITGESKELQKTGSTESLARWEAIAAETLTLDAEQLADMAVLRLCLLDFIADFANWDNSTVPAYWETSRALTQAAHEALGGIPGTRPLVVDPFAGGGSIPLEALRVGADCFASDLNPVAVLLNRVVLEHIPRYGCHLADNIRRWGQRVRDEAVRELKDFYPSDSDGAVPIAYLWARTIKCEGPGCGVDVPLIGNRWLSKRNANSTALEAKSDGPGMPIRFQLRPNPRNVEKGFTAGNSAECPACGYTTPVARVRAQLTERYGGSSDSVLLAVVTQQPGKSGKSFRPPDSTDHAAIRAATAKMAELEREQCSEFSLVPDELCPPEGALGFRFQKYGIRRWRDLYTNRQLVTLCTFTKIIRSATIRGPLEDELGKDLATVVQTLLALAIGRLNDRLCTLCRWRPDKNNVEAGNGGQNKMPMLLDFAESTPFGGSSGDWLDHIDWIARVIEHIARAEIHTGTTQKGPAQDAILPNDSAAAVVTDPPYFDAFGYSDLSEFFHIWLRRAVPASAFDMRKTVSRGYEAISIGKELPDGRGPKTATTYTQAMTASFETARRTVTPDGIGVVVFANKTTAGWEAILEGLCESGWIATASWPIDTELANRQRALGAAALNSSVHIVCRPREHDDGTPCESTGEWRDVLCELPQRIHEWMPRLAAEGVVGADAIFACLGPALEIFSRYSSVEKASGEVVPLREYLEHVWAAVSSEALSMIFKDADAAGLEPDARLTAMWLWTLGGMAAHGGGGRAGHHDSEKVVASTGYTLEFDAARKIAQGLGIHLEQSESIVEVKGDKARLLPVSERTRHLFASPAGRQGKDETTATTARGRLPAGRHGRKRKVRQRSLFEESDEPEAETEATAAGELKPQAGETVLDRVHQAMVLFASGRGEALRRFLVDDGVGTDARFWKLAQSLSALYPKGTDEKRWVDSVLARKKGLGL